MNCELIKMICKKLFNTFDSFRVRVKIYLFIGIAFFLLSTALSLVQAYFDDGPFTYIRSDGRAYYMYLPSLFIDGDLDFYNEIHNPWNYGYMPLNPSDRTELGYIKNKYPIGLSLSIMPAFLSAHIFCRTLSMIHDGWLFKPNGYSPAYQIFCTIYIMAMGVLSFILIDAMLAGYFNMDPKNAVVAVIAFWTGSHYAYYFFREPFMVHIVSAFWVTLAIFLVYQIQVKMAQGVLPLKRIFALVFSFSMALICRPTNIFLFFFLPYLALKIYRSGFMSQVLKWAPLFLMALIPIALQMAVWYVTTGHYIYYSYGDDGFFWKTPALWQTLFSSRHGLFFWAPILILSVIGSILHIRCRRARKGHLLFSYLMAFFALWYANSAWNMWWFGDAFGGRAFLELQGVFVIGLALFIENVRKASKKAQTVTIWAIGLCYIYNYIMMGLYIGSRIPRGDYLF